MFTGDGTIKHFMCTHTTSSSEADDNWYPTDSEFFEFAQVKKLMLFKIGEEKTTSSSVIGWQRAKMTSSRCWRKQVFLTQS